MEPKQTAVEWLVGKLTVQNDDGEVVNAYPDWIDLTELIEQAKEMEKQQIMELKFQTLIAYGVPLEKAIMFSEQYYNEEYGK